MTSDRTHQLRRAAVFHHAVTVLSFDAPMLKQIDCEGGKLIAASVKQIAREYRVARTFRGPEKEAKDAIELRLQNIADKINELADRIANKSLQDTATACLETANSLAREGVTPRSGVSKLLWFVRPGTGWTLYDSFAARGLKSAYGSGDERFRRFYSKLEEAGFTCAVSGLNEAMPQSFDGVRLYPERIIDAYLVLTGAPDPDSLIQRAQCVEATLPDHLKKPLADFADAISGNDDCWLDSSHLKKT